MMRVVENNHGGEVPFTLFRLLACPATSSPTTLGWSFESWDDERQHRGVLRVTRLLTAFSYRSEAVTRERLHAVAIVGLSLVGMAAMTPVALLQTGIVRHLPDPPLPRFRSDEAKLSDSAYQFGVTEWNAGAGEPGGEFAAGGRGRR